MTSRPWIIALAASAVVNVFLIGGLAGLAYARLTAPPVIVAAPAPRVVVAPSPAPVAPAAPVEVQPKPAHHAAVLAPQPVVTPPPPVVTAPPLDSTPPAQARPPLISAGDVLSPDSRKAFRRALSEANKKNKPLTQQARAERQAALAALGAPGYDAAEVSRHLASARTLDQQARGNVEAALASFTASLTPQERSALADSLARVYTPAAARRMEGPN